MFADDVGLLPAHMFTRMRVCVVFMLAPRIHDTAGPLAVATPTTRKLADASISVNTRRAYAGALRRLDAWRGAAPVDDASLAVYLGELFEAGRAPATAALAVAAVRFRAKLAGQPAPAGGSDRPRVGRLPSHGRRPGPGPGRPRCARTGSPRFSPPQPVPARTAGAHRRPRTPRRTVRLSSPQPRARASDRRPTPRLRQFRRAATQQAG